MSVTVVVGAQWGDEGKGKIVDHLAWNANMIIRFNGGGNAGHTVVIGDKTHALHLLPSGILREEKLNIVGPGVAFDLAIGAQELEIARAHGSRVMLDEGAPVVLPIHRAIDAGREVAAGSSAIGTTKRGIGPTYSDFWLRRGLTLGDLCSEARVREVLMAGGYWSEMVSLGHQLGLHDHLTVSGLSLGMDPLSLEETIRWCMTSAESVYAHVADTRAFVHQAYDLGHSLLFEGAQGIMLDAFQGSRPYCTSSLCTAAGVNATFGIYKFDRVIGVTKAYATRVGAGPFPTELHDEVGEDLRKRGHEYGTTTGRPRRCGWLDLPALKYACRMGGVTELVVTKLDVLSGMDISVCTHYKNHSGGSLTNALLQTAVPNFDKVRRWENTDRNQYQGVRSFNFEVEEFLAMIKREVGTPISGVSVGPERSQLFWI